MPVGTGTLAICNNVPAFNTIEAHFNAIIGQQILDGTGITTAGTASNNNIACNCSRATTAH